MRRELIRLHHLGIIQIVDVRLDHGGVPAKSYFQDYIWKMTRHARTHDTVRDGCLACDIRSLRILRAGGLA